MKQTPKDGETEVRLADSGGASMPASLSSSDFSSVAANGLAADHDMLPYCIATLKYAAVEMRLTKYVRRFLGYGGGISMDGIHHYCARKTASHLPLSTKAPPSNCHP
jgi:hypothetical protein